MPGAFSWAGVLLQTHPRNGRVNPTTVTRMASLGTHLDRCQEATPNRSPGEVKKILEDVAYACLLKKQQYV